MKIIVQKFGGTSVATPEGREQAARRVIQAKEEGFAPVVVVSAMGRRGEPYATDTLIDMVRAIENDVAPRELDLLVSCGEIISTVVMVQTLQKLGHEAVALTGGQAGICTDENHNNAQILHIDPQQIFKYAEAGRIVVVAGFQGAAQDGSITTLGRGGSDTSATALGSALHADVVEIYTDVDGVMTVDPRMVPGAPVLDALTYREVCEMAYQGAKVIHPRAVEAAMEGNVPIKVKNTFSDADGTLIAGNADERVITGLAHLANLAQIGVELTDETTASKTKVKVFKVLAEAKINIDLIQVTSEEIHVTVTNDLTEKAMSALKGAGFAPHKHEGCAKVSLIGAGMMEVPGVMARAMESLDRADVHVIQTSDSEITISFLIKEAELNKAVKALYEEFGLGRC